MISSVKKHKWYVFAFVAILLAFVGMLLLPGRSAHAATKQAPVFLRGNASQPKIALTFDDGPDISTEQVLAVLQREHVHGTFFMMGNKVEKNPALARKVVASGHMVGNHTWDHPELSKLTPAAQALEISKAADAIQRATGIRPTMTRPPFGEMNQDTNAILGAQGQSAILWDIDPRDWSQPGTQAIVNNVLANVHNGAIILMHDGGGDRSQTAEALSKLIPILKQRGYQFVSVPEVLG